MISQYHICSAHRFIITLFGISLIFMSMMVKHRCTLSVKMVLYLHYKCVYLLLINFKIVHTFIVWLFHCSYHNPYWRFCRFRTHWGYRPDVVPHRYPHSKVHGAIMGPIWGRQDSGGPHIGPMNFAIWVVAIGLSQLLRRLAISWIDAVLLSIRPCKQIWLKSGSKC